MPLIARTIAFWNALIENIRNILDPVARSGDIKVMFGGRVADFCLLNLPLHMGASILNLNVYTKVRANVMFVVLPHGYYGLVCNNGSRWAAMVVAAPVQIVLYEPALTIRLFDADTDMWLQLTIETSTDFWLLSECLRDAKQMPAPQAEGHDALVADIEVLLDVAIHLDEHIIPGISSIVETKRSEIIALIGALFLAFVSGFLFYDSLGMIG